MFEEDGQAPSIIQGMRNHWKNLLPFFEGNVSQVELLEVLEFRISTHMNEIQGEQNWIFLTRLKLYSLIKYGKEMVRQNWCSAVALT